jgi:hypothetical protein
MCRPCSTHGEKRISCRIIVVKEKERDRWEDLNVDGKIILK